MNIPDWILPVTYLVCIGILFLTFLASHRWSLRAFVVNDFRGKTAFYAIPTTAGLLFLALISVMALHYPRGQMPQWVYELKCGTASICSSPKP
jgi:uncharacterized iron-regulated membrane protein